MIQSASNPAVRMLRDLHDRKGRREHNAFLIEGVRLVSDAVDTSWPLGVVLFDPARAENDPALANLVSRIPRALAASGKVVQQVSDTVTSQGIVGAAALPRFEAPIPASDLLVLVLDAIGDPGNAGTLLRSALGSGAKTVLSSRGSVDLFSPKVVRSGMGAHFYLNLGASLPWERIGSLLEGREVVLADSQAKTPYYRLDWRRQSALIVASEAHGPSVEARDLASTRVSIPISPQLESLNAAVAGSVILFEATRQREDQGINSEPQSTSGEPKR